MGTLLGARSDHRSPNDFAEPNFQFSVRGHLFNTTETKNDVRVLITLNFKLAHIVSA
jgi:hypothetical protein